MKISISLISAILATNFCIAQNNLFPTGNVGIGTGAPNSKLVIAEGNNAISIQPGITNCIGFNRNALDGTIFNPAISGWQFSARDESFSLEGYNGPTSELFTVLKNGNFGIGIRVPSEKLDVKGGISSSLSDDGGGYIRLQNSSKTRNGIARDWRIYNMTGVYGNSLQFWAYDQVGCSSTEGMCANRFTIMDNGNVGIGTSSPDSKLSVNGNSTITAAFGGWTEGLNIDSPNGIWGGVKFRTVGRNGVNGNWHFGYDDVHSGATLTGNNIYLYNGSNNLYVMTYKENGNVGIGTKTPDSKLTVAGNIHAQEIKVTTKAGDVPDYVFANDYKLKSLQEVEEFIKENSHLPEIPSAKEIEKNGLMLAEMNMSLLKKMEEMTLYMIEMKKENEKQNNQIQLQNNKILSLEKKFEGKNTKFK